MKLDFKKLIAVFTAACAAVSMSGCMDSGKIMTVDGMEINNGVYLYYQQTAYASAQEIINKQYEDKFNEQVDALTGAESGSSESSSESSSSSDTEGLTSYFKETIDGKTTSDWVKDETLRLVKEFVAVQRKCEEKGIALEQSELDELSVDFNELWDGENFYIQYYYGFNTAGEYYESLGIGKDSYKQIFTMNELKEKLFEKTYGTDGETPVPDEELYAYLNENFAAVEILELPYTDYKGNSLTEDSDKKAVDETAEKYAQRLNNGESIIDVKYELDVKKTRDSVRSQAESYYDETPVEGKTRDEYVEEEVNNATVDKAESDEEIITYVQKDNNSLDEEVAEFVFSANSDGKAAVLKTDEKAYVIVRLDITKRESWIEDNKSSVVRTMKTDDYEKLLDDYAANYGVASNSYLVDSKYKPEKLEEKSS